MTLHSLISLVSLAAMLVLISRIVLHLTGIAP